MIVNESDAISRKIKEYLLNLPPITIAAGNKTHHGKPVGKKPINNDAGTVSNPNETDNDPNKWRNPGEQLELE